MSRLAVLSAHQCSFRRHWSSRTLHLAAFGLIWGTAIVAQTPSARPAPVSSMQLPLQFLDTVADGRTAGAPAAKIHEIRMGAGTFDFAIALLDSADAPGGPAADTAAPPLRVLFVGNSLTFYNEMPRLFAALAAAGLHRRVVVGLASVPGAPLSMLWQMTDVQQVIERLPWDAVVLQMRPMELHDSANLNRDARLYQQSIATRQARTVIWGQPRSPKAALEVQAALDSGFAGAAQAIGATLAPIPAAWEGVRQQADSATWQRLFYSETNTHPSPLGSYLISLLVYQAITGRSPVGLPHTAGGVEITTQDAELLQRVAASVGVHAAP